jgi:hypothetical protein
MELDHMPQADAREQILRLIPTLSSDDLGPVQAALNLTRDTKEVPNQPDISSDWILGGIMTYLCKRGVLAEKGAYWKIKKSAQYKTYLHKLPGIMGYMTRIEQSLTTVSKHRTMLGYITAKALAQYLEGQGIFCVSTMLSQIDKIPEAIEASYPNYVSSGMFGFILQMEKGK